MSDVVVTVPKSFWPEWIAEGDLPNEPWTGRFYDFSLGGWAPVVQPGERVYVVAHGKLRGYAPLVEIQRGTHGYQLVRSSGAVAVTIADRIPGFRGFRYRWWPREKEQPFPEWRTP